MPDRQWPTSILITGGSRGIGAALARAYARPGVILHLGGRDTKALGEVAESCRLRGAVVRLGACDVADAPMLARWIADSDQAAPLDLVIANAGVSAGTGGAGENADQARRIFEINLGGVVNTVMPAAEAMRARRAGQIAIVSSLAGFVGLPGSPAYSASKAAVRVWGEGLRGWLHESGISVSVVCPGYVTTGMTAGNSYPMPFLMDADRAARIVVRGLARRRPRIAFPWPMYFLAWLGAALPPVLIDRLMRRFPRKPASQAL